MGIALFKEKRFGSRRKLSGLLPGRIVVEGFKSPLRCRPTDVSTNGIGIIANAKLSLGTFVTLETDTLSIRMEIVWVAPDFGKHEMFRYGLIASDPQVNIEELFVTYGCLR